jgi:hypothetical protein
LIKDDQSTPPNYDEIEIKQLFLHLWANKIYLISGIVICICLASIYLNFAPRKYEVIYTLAPVINDDSSNLRGLGGLASFAGISLPSNSSGDFLTFRFLLTSKEVAEVLLQDKDLTRSIFRNEWNIQEEKFRAPDKGPVTIFVRRIKNLLTGDEASVYAAPNAPRLVNWVENNIEISEDRETGFLQLRSETSNPDLVINLMGTLSKVTDNLMRQRYVFRSQKITEFYNYQLSKAKAREHREALATLLAKEDQKLILALRGQHFIAEHLTPPTVSHYPTSPKSKLVLALSVLLGGLLGSGYVLVRKPSSK